MLGSVLPVILIFMLGVWCKKKQFLSTQTMLEIKKFIMNISLPCVLFQTFINMHIDSSHGTILIISFLLFVSLMIGGKLCNYINILRYKYNPYCCTGYAFGLVGLVLFSVIYGEENLEFFSIMGLAHELFVWILYYLVFRIDTQNSKITIKIVLNIFKSPIVISIMLGIILNLIGGAAILQNNSIGAGILSSVSYVAATSTPFILITLGYGLALEKKYLKQSSKIIGTRILVTIVIGSLFKILILDNFIQSSVLLDVSYISFLLLPPMFSLPLLVAEVDEQENVDVVNTVVGISTILSIVVFILFAFIVSAMGII